QVVDARARTAQGLARLPHHPSGKRDDVRVLGEDGRPDEVGDGPLAEGRLVRDGQAALTNGGRSREAFDEYADGRGHHGVTHRRDRSARGQAVDGMAATHPPDRAAVRGYATLDDLRDT